MLSIFSSLVPSQQFSLAGKCFRIALFSAFCALLIAPKPPAQAQSFSTGGLEGQIGTISVHWFGINISAVPAGTAAVRVTVSGGGKTLTDRRALGNSSPPFAIRFGSYSNNDDINPNTTYTVQVIAEGRFAKKLATSSNLTLTTKRWLKCTDPHNLQNEPRLACVLDTMTISNQKITHYSIEFTVDRVPAADSYRVPAYEGENCDMKVLPPVVGENGKYILRIDRNPATNGRPGEMTFRTGRSVSGLYLTYCTLAPNRNYTFRLEAYRDVGGNQTKLIAARTVQIRTMPAPSPQQLGEQSQDDAPPPASIYVEVDYPGDPLTDVSLSWEAVSGASAYLLRVSGGNSESYDFPLGAGATSQRVNGLTPGADYTAYLTAYLADGETRSGKAHFGMADPPPTNTPIPPTATPIPQQSSQDSVQQQDPPQLQYSEAKSEEEQQPSGPYASLIRTLIGYQGETQHGDAHVLRWTRALAALGWGSHSNPMTLSEAKTMRDKYSTSRWQPVVDALTVLQPPAPTNTPVPPPPPTNTPVPPPPPTNTPIPPPPPTNTPVPPPPPTNTPVPPPPDPEPEKEAYTVPQSLINTLIGYQGETQHGDAHVLRWTRALAALGHGSHNNPMTLSEAEDMADKYTAKRWQPVIDALEKLAED